MQLTSLQPPGIIWKWLNLFSTAVVSSGHIGGHAYAVSIFSSRSATPYPHCLQVDILCVELNVGLGSPNDRKQTNMLWLWSCQESRTVPTPNVHSANMSEIWIL